MYSFIVLGMVPGTNLQITWQVWLNVTGMALVLIASRYFYVHRHLIELVFQPVRQPLPASQLHNRIPY